LKTLNDLLARIDADAVVVGSSEGGLFNYGSDEEIFANLETLRQGTSDDFAMVGSASWDSPLVRMSHRQSPIAVRIFTHEAFHSLVQSAGWSMQARPGSATNQIFTLKKAS